ncbi:MAG: VirB4 family type IV secretion system protein [Candidatus Dormibacteria bacterium]
MKRERVHLANIKADVKFQYSGMSLTVREIACLGAMAPVSAMLFGLHLPGALNFLVPLSFLVAGWYMGKPEIEGIWFGTYLFYRAVETILPRAIDRGEPLMAKVAHVGKEGLQVDRVALPNALRYLQRYIPLMPRATTVTDGMFKVTPGGWRIALKLEAPAVGTHTDDYGVWVHQLVRFVESIGEPAQMVAVSEHFDRIAVQEAFDSTYRGRAIPLREAERDLVGRVAGLTLALDHFLIIGPKTAQDDGVPVTLQSPLKSSSAPECTQAEAEHVLEQALNLLDNHGLKAAPASREDLGNVLRETPLLCQAAVKTKRKQVKIGREYHSYITITGLPPIVDAGSLVRMLRKTKMRGGVSLYLAPVSPKVAIKQVQSTSSSFSFSASQSGDMASEAKAASARTMVQHLIEQTKSAHMTALTLDVKAMSSEECEDQTERVMDCLRTMGMGPELVSAPAFLPALAAAPGGTPLKRSLMMQTDGVVACLVPAQGTPFGQISEPYLGINAQTGTPAHLNVFRGKDEFGRRNAHLLCAGASGAGKSVAMKLLGYRHCVQGMKTWVVDPHSEYGLVMRALGGKFVDLMDHSINVLAIGIDIDYSPDLAAGEIMPVLSVMAGEEVAINRQGRAVRRLPIQSRGWLHGEVAAFFEGWRAAEKAEEPVIGDLLAYMETHSIREGATAVERDRCRAVMYSLQTFTQGRKGVIFNRPTSFELGDGSVAIGLKRLANEYASDLTPALAIILSWLYRELERLRQPMIILVDEAHEVTSDPDAGAVLETLVRGARKWGAGVWMASQQIDDFLADEGVGKTLAGQAATKVVLGLEDSMAAAAQKALNLTDAELSALTDSCPCGRAVVISGRERAIVDFDRGALVDMVNTDSANLAA